MDQAAVESALWVIDCPQAEPARRPPPRRRRPRTSAGFGTSLRSSRADLLRGGARGRSPARQGSLRRRAAARRRRRRRVRGAGIPGQGRVRGRGGVACLIEAESGGALQLRDDQGPASRTGGSSCRRYSRRAAGRPAPVASWPGGRPTLRHGAGRTLGRGSPSGRGRPPPPPACRYSENGGACRKRYGSRASATSESRSKGLSPAPMSRPK